MRVFTAQPRLQVLGLLAVAVMPRAGIPVGEHVLDLVAITIALSIAPHCSTGAPVAKAWASTRRAACRITDQTSRHTVPYFAATVALPPGVDFHIGLS